MKIVRRKLFEKLREKSTFPHEIQKLHLMTHLTSVLGLSDEYDEQQIKLLRITVARFCTRAFQKLRKESRNLGKFMNGDWANKEEDYTMFAPRKIQDISYSSKGDTEGTHKHSLGGRPSVSFTESSDRSKRRKMEALRKSVTSQEMAFAAIMKLREDGQISACKLIREVTQTVPSTADTILKAYKKSKFKTFTPMPLSPEEGLSYLIETQQSKENYQHTRRINMEHNSNIYLSYNKVVDAKKKC